MCRMLTLLLDAVLRMLRMLLNVIWHMLLNVRLKMSLELCPCIHTETINNLLVSGTNHAVISRRQVSRDGERRAARADRHRC
jgi:Na+/H+ antiporter NhaB